MKIPLGRPVLVLSVIILFSTLVGFEKISAATGAWLFGESTIYSNTDKLGIGTGTPTSRFSIHDETNINGALTNLSNGIGAFQVTSASNGVGLLFDSNQIEQMRADQSIFLNYNSPAGIVMNMGGGKVGIGTATPSSRLSIYDTTNISGAGNFTNAIAPLYVTSGDGVGLLFDSNQIEQTKLGHPLYLNANSASNVVTNLGGGRMGIGVPNPTDKLHVAGTTRLESTGVPLVFRESDQPANVGLWRIPTDGGGLRIDQSTDTTGSFSSFRTPLFIDPGGNMDLGGWGSSGNGGLTTIRVLANNGNVGIGTRSPSTKLHVEGNVKVNGNIVSDGDICIGKCN